MASAAIAEWIEVRKTYRPGLPWRPGVVAVDRVSLRLEPGLCLGLFGPNRSGKTTLLKMVLALTRPDSGRVERFGRPADERGSLARIGYVPEHPEFPDYLSAREVLEFYGTASGVSGPALRRRAAALLEQFGLADRAVEPIGRFSKGMVQRLALAQALINDPELLVLDEPTSGLDREARQAADAMLDWHRRAGRSALLVTHSTAELRRHCDRVAVLDRGRLVELVAPEALDRQRHVPAPRRTEGVSPPRARTARRSTPRNPS